jgi:16S rRNA G1207 methylase RsmC
LAAVKSGAFLAVKHLVDVGGGSGALAATLLAHQPACRATVMDLAPVCEASKTILASVESGSKVEYFPANFFADAWPFDADAFSLSNILHDWPLSRCREILRRAFTALPAGGRVFVLEALLDAERCTPRMSVLFNLLMQINHRGQQFTAQQLFELLLETGFSEPRVVHAYSYWSLVTARKPAS